MEGRSGDDVTGLLQAWRCGDRRALDQLLPLVERQLHQLAHRHLARERQGHTLETTDLVNEAYLRLVKQEAGFENRAHFYAIAATLMRRILIDHARRVTVSKRGGGALLLPLEEGCIVAEERAQELVALDDALTALGRVDERKSRVVELRYFAGLSVEETAALLGIHPDTVTRDWRSAKAFLRRQIESA